MALVVALASASSEVVVGHVVHDMRPRADALASRDAARMLADRVGLRFLESEITVRGTGGNYESNARDERYKALAAMAREASCTSIATGHHADDQLETLLMRLLRGAGPRGLGGLVRRRRLDTDDTAPLRLVRPMLAVARHDTEEICRATGTTWVEDATNLNLASPRNAIRHRVLPILKELAPRGAMAAVATADLMREAASVLESEARRVMERATTSGTPMRSIRWERGELRGIEAVVLGETVRLAAMTLKLQNGADQRGARALDPILAAMRDESTEPRDFTIGGLSLRIDAHAVVIRPLPSSP